MSEHASMTVDAALDRLCRQARLQLESASRTFPNAEVWREWHLEAPGSGTDRRGAMRRAFDAVTIVNAYPYAD